MTWHKQPRLKAAPESIQRLKAKVRLILHEGRGRSLSQVINDLNQLLRGWMEYFRLVEVTKPRALKSAMNGRGAWWNAGASHMNEAFPKSYFDRCGLISLLDQLRNRRFSM
jgi:RNA-directed DNA polymerase